MSDDILGGASERGRNRQSQSLEDVISEEGSAGETTRTTIDVPPEQYQLLRKLAYEEGRSQKEIWLEALEMYAHKKGY